MIHSWRAWWARTAAIVASADAVIFVGSRAGSVTTEKWRFPKPGECRIVHIDVDPDVVGVSYPTDATLIGDAKLGLAALADAVGERPGRYLVTNRAHGALGYSLPGVVGAQFGRPNSKCVAVMGDGSFGISAGEMEAMVRSGASTRRLRPHMV